MHSQVQGRQPKKYPPPIHSDLCSPTAYATRETRHGHIHDSGAYLDLPWAHIMSPVSIAPPHTSTSLGTHLVWSVSARLASGLTCGLMSLKPPSPLVISDISRCLHPPVPCAPKHHPMHTVRVFTRGGRTFACQGTDKRHLYYCSNTPDLSTRAMLTVCRRYKNKKKKIEAF